MSYDPMELMNQVNRRQKEANDVLTKREHIALEMWKALTPAMVAKVGESPTMKDVFTAADAFITQSIKTPEKPE